MRKIFLKLILFVSIISLLSAAPSYACTVFKIADSNNVFFGNNEDFTEKETYMWLYPEEKGKYGRVCFGFKNGFVQGGMNTEGLAVDWFARGGNVVKGDPAKPDYPGNINEGLLETCSTIEEAKALFEKYNFPDLGYANPLITDKSGSSAIVLWDSANKKAVFYENVPDFQIIGVGIKGAKTEFDKSKKATWETAKSMVIAASNGDTRYSGVYDLKNGIITLYSNHSFDKSVTFNLAEELKAGKKTYYIPDFINERANEEPKPQNSTISQTSEADPLVTVTNGSPNTQSVVEIASKSKVSQLTGENWDNASLLTVILLCSVVLSIAALVIVRKRKSHTKE